jgi:LPXTG-site transpeptidase (sortase) family protein
MQVLKSRIRTRRRHFFEKQPLVWKTAAWPIERRSKGSRRLRSRDTRRILSYMLFVVGGVLLTYVGGTYAWMYHEQHRLLREWKAQQAAGENSLVKLSIPRIHLRAVVLEGTSRRSLLLGPAHLEGTGAPGVRGNMVIAGHRDTFFRHIDSLRYGDDVYILKSSEQFHYVVVRKRVVESTNVSVLHATKDSELTLITCYPTHAIGPAPERLVITAKLKSGT